MMSVVNRDDNVKEIDKPVKNRFQWSWLEEKDGNGDFYSEYIRSLISQVRQDAWCVKTAYPMVLVGKKT